MPIGTWQPVVNAPTNFVTLLLLTDGSVMCYGVPNAWWKLTPGSDHVRESADYVHGTWTQLASGSVDGVSYATVVLKDGRVFRTGTDVNTGSIRTEIYDPLADTWEAAGSPTGWAQIGSAPCCVLPDGRVLVGNAADGRTAIYDPTADSWSPGGTKSRSTSANETWTLLPDGNILSAVSSGDPEAEKYLVAINAWVSAGVPSSLGQPGNNSFTHNAAILLPNGTVFVIVNAANTALYTPEAGALPGTWADGPTILDSKVVALGAALLPNGKVLCLFSFLVFPNSQPPIWYEIDPASANAPEKVIGPLNDNPRFDVSRNILLLPTGQVLYQGGAGLQLYTPVETQNNAWAPTITNPQDLIVLHAGHSYQLQGTQLNGLSGGVSHGYFDRATPSTNYPLVQFLNRLTSNTWHCRTAGHSTMAVATGSVVQTTNFTVPPDADLGDADLVAVANGIASDPVAVTIQADPCAPIAADVDELMREIKDLMEALDAGEIPAPPRTPAKIKEVEDFIASLRRKLKNKLQELRACRAGP